MMRTVRCPRCEQNNRIPKEYSQFRFRCGKCRQPFEARERPEQPLLCEAVTSLTQWPSSNVLAYWLAALRGRVVVLCDMSQSMVVCDIDRIARYQRLGTEVDDLKKHHPECVVVGFNERMWIARSSAELSYPVGDTKLAQALAVIAGARPAQVVIISDGLPNDMEDAVRAARCVSGPVHVRFCGHPADAVADRFLQSLAKAGNGTYSVQTPTRNPTLAKFIRRLLPPQNPPTAPGS